MSIGFFGSAKNEKKEDIDFILEQLNHDVKSFENLEYNLKQEFKEVHELGDNLKHLVHEANTVRRLHDVRDRFLMKIKKFFVHKNESYETVQSYFDKLSKVTSELAPRLESLTVHLEKLILDEKHALYSHAENRKLMQEISKEAGDLYTELHTIANHINSSDGEVRQRYQKFQIMVSQDKERKVKSKKIGFKT